MRLDTTQQTEESELRERLTEEIQLLKEYQSKTRMKFDAALQLEKNELDDKVSIRRARLVQKVTSFYFSVIYHIIIIVNIIIIIIN